MGHFETPNLVHIPIRCGSEARTVSVPSDLGALYGVWDRLHHGWGVQSWTLWFAARARRAYGASGSDWREWFGGAGYRTPGDRLTGGLLAVLGATSIVIPGGQYLPAD